MRSSLQIDIPQSEETIEVIQKLQEPVTTPARLTWNPFLKWFAESVTEDSLRKDFLLILIAVFLGEVATYNNYALGVEFGDLIADKMGANLAEKFVVQEIVGIVSYIPISVLVTSAIHGELNKLADFLKKKTPYPSRHNQGLPRKLLYATQIVLAVASGVPLYAITKTAVPGIAGEVCAAITLTANFFTGLSGLSYLVDNTFNDYAKETPDVTLARASISLHLKAAKTHFKTMSDDDINQFYQQFMTETATSDESALNKLCGLIKATPLTSSETVARLRIPQDTLNKKALTWIKRGFSMAVSIGSAYTLQAYAALAADWCSDLMNITDAESRTKMQESFIVLSTIPNVIFTENYVYQKLNIIQDTLTNKEYPSGKSSASTFIAALSTTANIYIASQATTNTLNTILIFCAFLGPTFSRSLAFEMLLTRAPGFFRKTFQPQSADTKRNKLIDMLDKLDSILSSLELGQILLLADNLAKLRGVTEQAEPAILNAEPELSTSKVNFHYSNSLKSG